MNDFKKYENCPILSDDENTWRCAKRTCPYYINGCSLSPMIESLRKIIIPEIEKELTEEEGE